MKRLVLAAVCAAVLCVPAMPAVADHFGPRRGPPHHGGWGGPWPPPQSYGAQVVYAEPAPLSVVPASDPYLDSRGRYCREYQTSVMVGGAAQPAYGTACRMPDGAWRIVR